MRPFALLLPLALMACIETEIPPPVGACGAADLQYLVGQPDSVLQTQQFAGPVRIIYPGMAVTMDYSESRLNIEIDAAGRISRVYCG